jgi:hypothetical protein
VNAAKEVVVNVLGFQANYLDLFRVLLVATLAFPVLPARAADDGEMPQWGMGPFEVRDPSILGELRAAPMARSPRTLKPFELEIGVRQTQESTYVFADDTSATSDGEPLHRLTVDAETRDTNLVLRMGVLPRLELGAELDAVHFQGGGFLDGLITAFHRAWGMGTLRRDRVPLHSYIVEGTQADGRPVSFPRTGTGLGDAVLTPRVLLFEGGEYHPAVALTLQLWMPTASPLFEHAHGLAETLSLDASKRLLQLPVVFYAGGAYTYYDEATVHGLSLTRHRFMGYVGFEWEVTPRISLVTHFWQETLRERALLSSDQHSERKQDPVHRLRREGGPDPRSESRSGRARVVRQERGR